MIASARALPRWVLISLITLLVGSGIVYAAGIPLGLVHNYYGPAVYSMAHSWRAFFWAGGRARSIAPSDARPWARVAADVAASG